MNPMPQVLTYNDIDPTEWGRFVCSCRTGTWFQSPEAYRFFTSLSALFQPFVVAVGREQTTADAFKTELKNRMELRGICVGYVTREPNALRQLFTRRAIILGGPALADDATPDEVRLLMSAVRSRLSNMHYGKIKAPFGGATTLAPIYIETRNFNDYSAWRVAFEQAGFSYRKHLNYHVDCSDKVAMDARMSDNRKRQIKKASATVAVNDEQDIRAWYGILQRLYREKVKTPLWPIEFFVEAYRQGVGQFLLVKHEGKVIGGSMVVVKPTLEQPIQSKSNAGTVYEWYECGLNAEYKEQYPSVLATYAGMCYASDHCLSRYDMMGAGEPGVPYGVRDFKSEFGGEQVEHGRYLCVEKPILYRLGVQAVKLMKKCK